MGVKYYRLGYLGWISGLFRQGREDMNPFAGIILIKFLTVSSQNELSMCFTRHPISSVKMVDRKL